jgi:hypothetical protein
MQGPHSIRRGGALLCLIIQNEQNMKSIKKILYATFCVMLVVSCSNSELGPRDYVAWMESEENSTLKVYRQGDLKLNCQYMTPEYSALKQQNPESINVAEVRETADEISDLVEFKLSFEREGQNNFMHGIHTTEQEYTTESMYLAFDIRYDLSLVSGGDTIPCAMNHHERTYGNTPYETLLVAFERPSATQLKDMELIFDDRVFGYGRVKFYYSGEELGEIPSLEL